MGSVKVFGIDFTSSPRKRKPIVCAEGKFVNNELAIRQLEYWENFEAFELFLQSDGAWFAGLDFPFGLPAEFLSRTQTPLCWVDYVGGVARKTKQEFCDWVEAYSRGAPTGEKHLFRRTDRRASACSPMMIYGVPVAKMFYEGATRMLDSDVSVFPCRPTRSKKVALEAYPALVSRRLIGRASYKSGSKKDGTEQRIEARQALLDAICGDFTIDSFGFGVKLDGGLAAKAIQDDTGDSLDACLCCIQAAWASSQPNYGVPDDVVLDEGWIITADVLA